jgi:hypothetical protein
MNQRVYVLACPCGEQIVLPHQSPLGRFVYPHCLPTDKWPVVFVCTHCEHTIGLRDGDIRPAPVEVQAQSPHSESFWYLEFECVRKDSPRLYGIATKFLKSASEEDVKSIVFSTISRAPCGCAGNIEEILQREYCQMNCFDI